MSAEGLKEIQDARAAGFSDQEINDFINTRKAEAGAAGFSPTEVDEYYGSTPFDDAPIKALLTDNHKAATTPTGDGKTPPKPITNFLEAIEAGLQMSVSGLAARGKAPDLAATEDTPRSLRIASNVASLAGDVPAMVGGYLAGGGQITGMAGAFALPTAMRKILMDKYEKGEVRDFSDFWDRLSGVAIDTAKSWITGAATGAVGKVVQGAAIPSKVLKGAAVTSSELATMVTVGNALEGKVPSADEFIDTAIALGFVKGAVGAAKKIRNIYAETGVTPEQLARDAEKDPTIHQDLASDNIDIPRKYQDPALKKVGESISVGAQPESKTVKERFNDVYTKMVDDLNPIREEVKKMNELIPEEKIGVNPDPYQLMRLLRGSVGRAAHFLEQGTYDFKTLKNTGSSLRDILREEKDIEGLRSYLVAKRTVELGDRNIDAGVDIPTAKAAVKEGAARFDATAKALTDYQNRVTKYLKDSGVLSEEAYGAMLDANKHYVPFFRVMDEQAKGPGKGSSVENPIHGIKGSKRQIIDPLESVIKNTYVYVALAERNAANASFLKHADSTGSPDLFYKKVPAPTKGIELREEEIQKLFKAFVTERQRVVSSNTTDTTTTKGGAGQPDSKAFTLVKNRVIEALKARGFSEGETMQMVERLMSKGGEVGTVETVMKQVEKTELVQELNIRLPHEAATVFRSMRIPLRPNEIAVFKDGKRSVYEVDPDVATAFKAMDAETANMFVKIIALPAKTLRAGAILSPDFMARNALRDQISAMILSKGGYFPIFDFARGALSLIKKDEAYGNWLKSGGANAAMVSVDRQYLSQHVFQLSKETGLMERAWNVMKSPVEVLRIASELVENSTRLGEFKKLTDAASTKPDIQQAGFASREVTLDFARIGANMRAVNMISAFTNAQIQGLDRVVRGFGEKPVAMSAKIAAAVTLPSLLLWWANKDDPRWESIPHWQKDLFWIVMTKDTIYRIPKPFEVGLVFGTLPERSMELFFKDNPDALKQFDQSMMDAFLPNLTPQIAQPIIEQFSNRSLFTGTPIVPAGLEKLLPEYQYNEYTTELTKAIGGIMGAFPGLRDRSISDEQSLIGGTARALSTPALLENYIRSWTGGLGMYVVQLADKNLRLAGVLPDPVKPTPTLADIPMVKAFVVRYPSAGAQQIQDFYNDYELNKRYIDTVNIKAKEGDPAAIKVLEEHTDRMADFTAMKDVLSEHSQLVRLVSKNPDIPADEKRQIIDTTYYRMIEIAEMGRKAMREAREELAKP